MPAPRRVPRARIVNIEMPSERSAIAVTVDRVLEAASGAGLSKDRLHDLAVATAEALSNAAIHGNRLRREAAVRITVTAGPRAVTVDVKDGGRGFDHRALTDPTDPARLLDPGGRGVFIMKSLVDRLQFMDHGSRVRLVMEAKR